MDGGFSRGARAAIVVSSFALVAVVGYIDGRTCAYVAFSIFYLIPLTLVTWFGSRTVGFATAAACAVTGLAADVWTIHSARIPALANLGLRLILFVAVVGMLARLKKALIREKEFARSELEVSRRLEETNALNEALMQAVATEARAPIGDIYAKVVTLSFQKAPYPSDGSREILDEVAEASLRLSALVKLLQAQATDKANSSGSVRHKAS